jgi:F420H(2)-dependent quinone reductase
MEDDTNDPEAPGEEVDLRALPEAGWIYGQNQALKKLDQSERRKALLLTSTASRSGHGHHRPRGTDRAAEAYYHNLKARRLVRLQDLTTIGDFAAREIFGDERALWWGRAVQTFGPYAGYAQIAGRPIPVFVLEPVSQ